ncbi:hypothetical protein BDV96DRAFT_126617 [Lophiotrema nucula]|uniref:Uncharacterized protein n=1 Tax=Lophiotrema nucula TaxID=690887 RepID=A0A6A5Z1Z1_9PLEO|nr:hypothetical protein BDV96DRAFT_126617 [Lophiotrema nucula]
MRCKQTLDPSLRPLSPALSLAQSKAGSAALPIAPASSFREGAEGALVTLDHANRRQCCCNLTTMSISRSTHARLYNCLIATPVQPPRCNTDAGCHWPWDRASSCASGLLQLGDSDTFRRLTTAARLLLSAATALVPLFCTRSHFGLCPLPAAPQHAPILPRALLTPQRCSQHQHGNLFNISISHSPSAPTASRFPGSHPSISLRDHQIRHSCSNFNPQSLMDVSGPRLVLCACAAGDERLGLL